MRNRSVKTNLADWSTGTFEEETFLAALEEDYDSQETLEKMSQLCQCVAEACDFSAPTKLSLLFVQLGNLAIKIIMF